MKHTREYLWNQTDVIVLGNKDPERGGIPGTFWRVPTDLKSWDLVIAAGGPGAITSGTKYDNTLRPRRGHCPGCGVSENQWCYNECSVEDRMDYR